MIKLTIMHNTRLGKMLKHRKKNDKTNALNDRFRFMGNCLLGDSLQREKHVSIEELLALWSGPSVQGPYVERPWSVRPSIRPPVSVCLS